LDFGPCGPTPPAPARYALQATGSSLGPLGPSRVGVFAESRILYDFAHSGRDAFSISCHCHVGPACQLHPLPHSGLRCHFSSSPLATPRCPAPPLDTARAVTRSAIISPLIPLLTLPPSSMALKPLMPPLLPPATPLRRCPGPYKRMMRPPDLTAPHPLSPELLHALLRPRDELKPSPFVASGAPPRCHSSVTGEHRLNLQWVRCKLDETIE
jgi:hypothetical protein